MNREYDGIQTYLGPHHKHHPDYFQRIMGDSKCAWDTSLIEPPSCPLRSFRWAIWDNLANPINLVNFDPFDPFGQFNHDKMIKSDMINSKPEETRAADLEVSTPFFNPLDGALYLHPKTS